MFSEQLRARFITSKKIVVLTGAGFSAESGIATFRDKEGLWVKNKPEDLATQEAFQRDPYKVLEWYFGRRRELKEALPNPGHFALADLEKIKKTVIITQNVDGLHQKAGCRDVVELHGSLLTDHCNSCRRRYPAEEVDGRAVLRHCACGGTLRPSVVWFGEELPEEAISRALDEPQSCDFFIAAGTSAKVQPAGTLPLVAKKNNAFVMEINREETVLSSAADESVRGQTGEVLPLLVGLLKK
jgi:NAD-dependent deacetylase